MKILTYIKNDSPSISLYPNKQSSLIEKIRNLIANLLSFIRNHTFSVSPSESTISKQVAVPLNLSHEILRVLDEEKSAQGNKKDLDFITFFFHEAICDPIKDTSTNKSIYDVPKNNRPVLEEFNYEEIYGPAYDIPSNKPDTPKSNRPISEEPIYEEINEVPYDIPSSNKPLYDTPRKEEPIYEEIDESRYRVANKKIINDTPPPLPRRNWEF